MKTIHELRAELEQAQAAYLAADIEHPTDVLIAKDNLANARFDYWAACADLVTQLPKILEDAVDYKDNLRLPEVYKNITGEELL